ncbi:MGMT family protein [Paenibacillus sp. OV219]|uniref:MGMT family protein n=1 Tax=Paenibacillus sp. OV219 TaxID=1884377 RepID=UPI0008C99A22|nr:methylated-DNA--[protein]-cysteine S-methyltransferase [Paenibacillus sp. OV219]SEO37138.1 methylated-DNA-protein-cysteine methyltransferase related protein [Paenibacillus sp. OV219]
MTALQPFTERVIAVIRSIPAGSVMTYGQIAEQAGSPRAARQVVRILHSLSEKHNLPWHRVINAKGEIAIGSDEGRFMQRYLLEEEGVYVNPAGFIDLGQFRHGP